MSVEAKGRALRPKQAAARIGFSVTSLWRYCRTRPDFPKPVQISTGMTIFFENEIDQWLELQAQRARAAAA
ncbi:AlpA family phage regulatory protein [Caballeronia sp. GAFFF2]|uniref:helix-turn-helix transcriptional regulator n=1 Tax=Caballeronia sp. GAFFF2 TaxID=2921741 RepID=UPI0020295BB1|nr:AlpA family phage regulatory protein [Caballeronia sp. GAFFF2]